MCRAAPSRRLESSGIWVCALTSPLAQVPAVLRAGADRLGFLSVVARALTSNVRWSKHVIHGRRLPGRGRGLWDFLLTTAPALAIGGGSTPVAPGAATSHLMLSVKGPLSTYLQASGDRDKFREA